MRELAPGYTSEVDTLEDHRWDQILQEFDDANIYQTWPYGAVTYGRRNTRHLVLRKDGNIAAIALARIAKLPLINVGIAYVRWGPLWRRAGSEADPETFRQAIRALRNEFVCRQGLAMRLFPLLFDDDSPCFLNILREEGFSSLSTEIRARTILMDLSPSLKDLRAGMGGNWKRNLKLAERNELTVIEGSEDRLFEAFIDMYKEMVARKKFVESNDVNKFKTIQAQLPDELKMRIMLCESGEGLSAGLICSAIGKTAIYLFGATSNAGKKSSGAYLLHWKLIEQLKRDSFSAYNLHGINPIKNPGTYTFKKDLAGKSGKDVYFLGQFDSHPNVFCHFCLESGDKLRRLYRRLKELAKASGGSKLWAPSAN
jgi:lipid II:glycine glycyltransferase (peptidoglycan interpeptide bridge formation enzyme)